MDEQELMTALEHDAAQRVAKVGMERPLMLAAECLRNAALASRGAECALTVCKPPGVVEARQAAQLAVVALEQALVLMAMEQQSDE